MVLEARYKAKEVGYNIVGEERKEASNVIDYNINEEQTKDAFAKLNANNDTTTGMANVIPGVNAPKLLAATSIIGGAGGVTFGELGIGSTSTMSANTFTNFNSYTINTPSSDISIEPGSSHHIIIKKGIYFIYLFINVHNIYTTFSGAIVHRSSDGNGSIVAEFDDATETVLLSSAYEFDGDGYVTIGINPSANVSNLSHSVVRFVKLG